MSVHRMKNLLVTTNKSVSVIDHAATGARFQNTRKGSGISLRTLAAKIGFSAPYVSDLENGRRNWSEDLAKLYLDALTALKVAQMTSAKNGKHTKGQIK